MNRHPPPRLPELGGMTEAGFNRIVAMIRETDFMAPHQCARPWGWRFPVGCETCQGFLDDWRAWRASLPKVRNKKQRKAANVPRWTDADIRKMHEGASEIDAFFSFDPVKAAARELVRQFHDGELGPKDKRPESPHTSACSPAGDSQRTDR